MDLKASADIIRDALGVKDVMIQNNFYVTTIHDREQRELSVSLSIAPPFRTRSGHSHVSGTSRGTGFQPTLDDLLDALEAAMSETTENECSCCHFTKNWPSFDELAAKLTEYHHGL